MNQLNEAWKSNEIRISESFFQKSFDLLLHANVFQMKDLMLSNHVTSFIY